ncbi:MAG: Pilus assembly protein [Prosthecobacter sp.]|nr:Pilus assembly protein [Prosthecobacter sp.]
MTIVIDINVMLDVFLRRQPGWKRVRGLPMTDFEDAAVALSAEENGAAFFITRNEADFVNSPVPAINPASFLGCFMPKL